MHPNVQKLLGRAQIPQRTPEWYVARKSLITASEVASALDIKPFESYSGSPRTQLLKEKMHVTARGVDNVFTQHGNRYEDEARDIYCEMTGEKVYEFGLIVHAEYPWLGCSVDGVTESGYVLEIKCPLSRKIEPGVVPHHYYPQVQICMEVCDLEEARFIQYKPESITWPKDREFDVAVVHRDRAWFEEMRPRLEAFVTEMKERQAQAPPAETAPVPPVSSDGKTPTKPSTKPASVCYITE
jgi:putative phage-type endonuclease